MDFWVRAAQLILSLSILIVLHEFGHFLPARWFKTRVEKFYLFFNPYFSLFKKQIGETEWGIGWLPLGGYVKIAGMIDESMDKEQMAQPAQPWEFRSKKAWQRLIIMMGGVIVNVIVGFILFIMVLAVWGEQKLDQSKMKDGLAVHPFMEQFGFRSGDKILKMDGEEVDQIADKIGSEILIFGHRNFEVLHADGKKQTIMLPENIGEQLWTNNAEQAFTFRYFLGKIDSVTAKSTAARIGLKKGDKILSVNDQDVLYFDEFKSLLYNNKGKVVDLEIQRNGTIIHKRTGINKEGQIGVITSMKPNTDTAALYIRDYSFGESMRWGIGKGLKTMYGNIAQFKYVFTSKGAQSVGGFGSIGKLFPTTWNWQAFWTLTAFLSMMLAVMNMLPIPALDGGHVMFLLYEIITGREPSQKFMEIAQYIGFFLLIGLLLFANGNDIVNLFSGK
ncbi:MAG: RIP metalloprotease RseP [Fluviicola sp.]